MEEKKNGKNLFKSEGIDSYAKASRQMARDSKRLMQKALGQLVEQMGLDSLEELEGDQLKLITDYLSFRGRAFDLIELQADALETQEERLKRIDEKLDKILAAKK